MTTTIYDLPKDILWTIFNNLPIHNLKTVEKVCRKWRNILMDGYFSFRLKVKMLQRAAYNNTDIWTIEKDIYYRLLTNKCHTCFGDFNMNHTKRHFEKCAKCKGWFHFNEECMPTFGISKKKCYECSEYSICNCGTRYFSLLFKECEKCHEKMCLNCALNCVSCVKRVCTKCSIDATEIACHFALQVSNPRLCDECIGKKVF